MTREMIFAVADRFQLRVDDCYHSNTKGTVVVVTSLMLLTFHVLKAMEQTIRNYDQIRPNNMHSVLF